MTEGHWRGLSRGVGDLARVSEGLLWLLYGGHIRALNFLANSHLRIKHHWGPFPFGWLDEDSMQRGQTNLFVTTVCPALCGGQSLPIRTAAGNPVLEINQEYISQEKLLGTLRKLREIPFSKHYFFFMSCLMLPNAIMQWF